MTRYEDDVIAWSREQAALLRDRRFALLDLEHLADEIEDVGKSEQRELESRLIRLLAHLLKWQYQAERRGNGWRRTIAVQRRDIDWRLRQSPSLKHRLGDQDWLGVVWDNAVVQAIEETGLDLFPESCPWNLLEQILDPDWLPE